MLWSTCGRSRDRCSPHRSLCRGPPLCCRGRSRPIVPHDDGDGEAGQGPVEAVALAPVARGALSAALRVLHHDDPWQADDGRPS